MGINGTQIFSLREAEYSYKNIDRKCVINSECPYLMKCEEKCYFMFKCMEDNLSRCTVNNDIARTIRCFNGINDDCDKNNCILEDGVCRRKPEIECNQNDDCLSGKCKDNICVGKIIDCVTGNKESKCGLSIGKPCLTNKDCLGDYCKDGVCDSSSPFKGFSYFFFTLVGITVILIGCCAYYFFKSKKPKESNEKITKQ